MNTKLFTSKGLAQPEFLPMSKKEMDKIGWDELDVLLISGDSYVDHPSFGMALLGRVLVAHGFRTGIITQPDWEAPASVQAMGRPRLFAGVTAGAIDSMLAHYTAFRKKRSDDAYTPGGLAGARPNRAVIVYTNLIRRAFPGLPVVLGGIEASLRRTAHYDFWTDKVRRSVLLDSKADLLVYGMGEKALIQAAQRLNENHPQGLKGILGTVFKGNEHDIPKDAPQVVLSGFSAIQAEPRELMAATLIQEQLVQAGDTWAIQDCGQSLVIAPPAPDMDTGEMDRLYALPYARLPHPAYTKPIPAHEVIKDSVTSHRGCGGGCSFCSLALHQGRRIRSRSEKSILDEVRHLAKMKNFKGNISDIGGPSANMWQATCENPKGECKRSSCMVPTVCPYFKMDHRDHLDLLRKAGKTPGIKTVRVASGVRFDLAMQDRTALEHFLAEFVGGQLKIAPEHIEDKVLKLMRKPGLGTLEKFLDIFGQVCRKTGKEQYVVPYLISAFPGCTDQDMHTLKNWLQKRGWRPRQVQCFIPTPGTVATAMFHAEIDPRGDKIFVAKTDAQRLKQHHILIPERPDAGRRKPGPGPARPKSKPAKPGGTRKLGKGGKPFSKKRKK